VLFYWGDDMNYVEPITDNQQVHKIADYLKSQNDRNYILFLLGIYTGLRISDILSLRVKDVHRKKCISIRERKTGKQQLLEINPVLRKELDRYCQDKHIKEYLIKSREGVNKPLGRVQAYNILRSVADVFNINNMGCHTLRKTFGYHFYKQTNDIVTLQHIFNHDHPSVTLKYIGIKQEAINQAIKNFKI